MGLTGAEILAFDDRTVEKVKCPEWCGDVYVRSLSLAEALKLELEIRPLQDVPQIIMAQLAAFACDEAGAPLFESTEAAMPAMNRQPRVLRRIVDRGLALNRMGKTEDEKQKS